MIALLFTLFLSPAPAAKPDARLQDGYIQVRNQPDGAFPVEIPLELKDIRTTLPAGWSGPVLTFGQQLYFALASLRLGYTHVANNELKHLIRTLGEINLLVRDCGGTPEDCRRLGERVLREVAEGVATKLGPFTPAERESAAIFFDALSGLAGNDAAVREGGREARGEEVESYRRSMRLRWATRILSGISLVGVSFPARFFYNHPELLTGVAAGSIGVSLFFGVGSIALSLRPMTPPVLPQLTDENFVAGPVRDCQQILITGATEAS